MTKREQSVAQSVANRVAISAQWLNPPLRDAIVVVRIKQTTPPPALFDLEAGWVEGSSARVGRRIVRLLYFWEAIEPAARESADALGDLVSRLAQPGEVLRARVRFERDRENVQDA